MTGNNIAMVPLSLQSFSSPHVPVLSYPFADTNDHRHNLCIPPAASRSTLHRGMPVQSRLQLVKGIRQVARKGIPAKTHRGTQWRRIGGVAQSQVLRAIETESERGVDIELRNL